MRKVAIVFLTFVIASLAVQIELHDGQVIETRIVKYEKTQVLTDINSIPRDEIKSMVFAQILPESTGVRKADQDIQRLLDMAQEEKRKYPEAKGIDLLFNLEVTLNDDGTRSYSYRLVYLILSEARKEVATFKASFLEGENEVNIIFGRVIKPSGRVIELDPSTIRIEKPPREDIVFFSKDKWVTFTLPEVEVGDIIEYSAENIYYNPWNKEVFHSNFYFQDEDPASYLKYVVKVPSEECIKHKDYNMPEGSDYGPIVEDIDGDKVFTWIAEDVKSYVLEPHSPPTGDFLPKVEVTNQPDWDEIFNWYAGFQKERMKVTPQIQALADSLSEGALTDQERLACIYHWIQQNIRYISIKGAVGSGVSGHPAQITLERGFGDCTDKSILFSTLLKAINIDAFPVYVGTNNLAPLLDPEIPSFYGNHCITEVFLPDTSFYLDATGAESGGYSRYPSFAETNHGVYAVNAQKRKVELVPIPSPGQELRHYHLDMEIDEEGVLTVNYQSFYNGNYETVLRYYWNYFTREEDRRLTFEKMIKHDLPDAELTDYDLVNVGDLDKQLSLKMSYRVPDFVKFVGPLAIINLPDVQSRFTFNEVALAERKFPLVYPSSEGIQHHINLKLPEDWKVDWLPGEMDLFSDELKYKASYTIEQDNLIRFEDDYARYTRLIESWRYEDYRKLLNTITNYHQKPILVLVGEK
ncbi:DUF3857 and transglutaminase domain-containing protein [candidate division WOR-3 bacterium]|nr:DUF3857 and transglutaminase domain-containing protein [candidate division WOR-3 bacterium]